MPICNAQNSRPTREEVLCIEEMREIVKQAGESIESVVCEDYRHGRFAAQSNTRYEGCRFFDAQFILDGVENVEIVDCDFRSSTILLKDASNVQIVANRFEGEWLHENIEGHEEHVAGPTASIQTTGSLVGLRIYGNRFLGVLRGVCIIVNTGRVRSITHALNMYAGCVRTHPDFNRGEAFLIHGSEPGVSVTVYDVRLIRDTWMDWSPVNHHGDANWGSMDDGWLKAAIHIHDVNIQGLTIVRPGLSEQDVIRIVASNMYDADPSVAGAQRVHARHIRIISPPPGRGALSMYGNVTNFDSGGMRIIDRPSEVQSEWWPQGEPKADEHGDAE